MRPQNPQRLHGKKWQLSLMALTLFILSPVCFSANNTNNTQSLEKTLLSHIAKAQKALSTTEQRMANERLSIAREINALESDVIALRKKTTVARRLADEKTLSLAQLETRLETWQKQGVYQQNLLNRYLQQYAKQSQLPSSPSASDQIRAVLDSSERLSKRFSPHWQTADIIGSSGEIHTLPTLGIGPVTWYWDGNKAGLASEHGKNGLQSDLLFTSAESDAIATLRAQPIGEIIFDPTLTRAMARQKHSEGLIEHLVKGGLWAIPILLFALFALGIALLKVVQLWRLPKLVRFTPSVLNSVIQDSTAPQAAKVKGMQRNLLDIGTNTHSPRQRDDLLFMQLQEDKHKLERWIGAIAITAAVSPLLGLLGTVSGMIETFKMMTLFGSGDPEVVSGGIAQALITTELGLVVAIPALVLNAVLSRRAKNYYAELEGFAILISKSNDSDPDPNQSSKTKQKITQKSASVSRPTRSVEGAIA